MNFHSIVTLSLAGLLLLPCCDRPSTATEAAESGQPQAPRSLTLADARIIDMPRTVRATGTIFGDEQTTIAAKVSGRVQRVHKDLGDEALPGESLITIDPVDYTLARNEREMAFQQSLAKLGLTELSAEAFDLSALPTIERARLEAENARVRYERGKQLAEREPPLISEQDFTDLQTTWEVAQSNLRVAELEAQAGLAEARMLNAQLRMAEQRVTDTIHRAPEEENVQRQYAVSSRLVAVGDFVQEGDPLIHLVDVDPVKLRASVPERMLNMVRTGQRAAVHVEGQTEAFEGEVSRVSPSVDERTRTNLVEILIANSERTLKPGSFAIAEVEVGIDAVVAVPSDAVTTFAGVSKVFVVSNGLAKSVRVETGKAAGEWIEVRSGLSGEERVVRRPPADLVTDTPVQEAVAADAKR